ncbi:MAG: hypothetical protein DBX55_08380 [Verrucomicrobia bacterium]|nr:MAG: hypothetical protein DBX55_08380 [Verrucomicrobiota bacterium]
MCELRVKKFAPLFSKYYIFVHFTEIFFRARLRQTVSACAINRHWPTKTKNSIGALEISKKRSTYF